MASPQTKNGFTRVANEILEHIVKTNLNGTQFRIVMVIWRYTYGYGQTKRELPITKISELIGTKRGHVDRELTSLIDRNVIKSIGVGPRRGRILSFNKNYEEWKNERPPDKVEQPVPVKKAADKKIKQGKEYHENSTYYKMAVYFHKRVSIVAKEAGVEHLIKKANLQKWSDDFRKLVEIDEVDKRLAKDVMDWVTMDPFWKTNVLSAKKLREKFTDLAIRMNSAQKPKQQQLQPPDIRDKEIALQRWIADGNDPDAFNWGE
jgi:phage replication O-like protein O